MGQTFLLIGFKKFKMNPTNERDNIYKCCPLKTAFTITAETVLQYSEDVGLSMYFRGQANEVVTENTTNQLEPQIRKIALR